MKGGSSHEPLPPFVFLEIVCRRCNTRSCRVHFTSKEILPVRVPSSEQGIERLIDGPVELC